MIIAIVRHSKEIEAPIYVTADNAVFCASDIS